VSTISETKIEGVVLCIFPDYKDDKLFVDKEIVY